jgi:membrane protease YdiL (CAAX protease family)
MSALQRFFLASFVLCFGITVPIALEVQGVLPFALLPRPAQWLIGFVPLAAAAIALRGQASRAAWWADAVRWRAPLSCYAIALLAPWLILSIAMGLTLVLGSELPKLEFGGQLAVFFLVWTLLGWGEEAGWRAFALPRMNASLGFLRASTLLGAIWAVWHFPKIFCSPYLDFSAASLAFLGLFTVQILLGNYLLCALFARSRSAVVCAAFHGSTNVVSTAWIMAPVDLHMIAAYVLVLAAGAVWVKRSGVRLDPGAT